MLIEKQELRSQEIYRMRTQIKELNDDFDKLNDALKKYVLSFLEEHEYVASLVCIFIVMICKNYFMTLIIKFQFLF